MPASSTTASISLGLRARVQIVVPLYVGVPDQTIVLVGSAPELGRWDVSAAPRLTAGAGHIWRGEVELPVNALMEAKVRMNKGRESPTWRKPSQLRG